MEKEVTRRMIELIGWPAGEGDAIFTPGKKLILKISIKKKIFGHSYI